MLYRLLWRLRAEPHLLKIASDPDVRRFEAMEKSVRRDIHKMRAFVRFRQIGETPDERYVAWFEPDHFIVERNAPFLRAPLHRHALDDPDAVCLCAHWDGETLAIGPGAGKSDAPAEDAAEALWRTYYQNIFNPARLKVKAMQAEMPKKYWRNLPEASLIPDLIAGADEAAREMIAQNADTPAPHHAKVQAKHWPSAEASAEDDGAGARIDRRVRDIAEGLPPLSAVARRDADRLRRRARECASVVFVGEQPGDQEDIAGKPFVGPAGKVFDAFWTRPASIAPESLRHQRGEALQIRAARQAPHPFQAQCRRDTGLPLVAGQGIVADQAGSGRGARRHGGAVAARQAVTITKMRGEVIEREDGLRVFLTVHPSFILRIREPEDKQAERQRFLRISRR